MIRCLSGLLLCVFVFTAFSCRKNKDTWLNMVEESKEAKEMFQGIWVDNDSESVAFKVEGDTIFYPDSTSMPAFFKIVNDSLIMGGTSSGYPIVKQTAHVFWFRNSNGDLIKLVKTNDPNGALAFRKEGPKIATLTEVLKKDTVVMYDGERYHCYVAVNPTRYKVVGKTYNDDGVAVENIYYDNIIHVSVFHGAKQLYSRDFNKNMFSGLVPKRFLVKAILNDMDFSHIDSEGFHFNATMCVPDAASCYMLDTSITFDGKMSMEMIDY